MKRCVPGLITGVLVAAVLCLAHYKFVMPELAQKCAPDDPDTVRRNTKP